MKRLSSHKLRSCNIVNTAKGAKATLTNAAVFVV